jgi:hypothetical protein
MVYFIMAEINGSITPVKQGRIVVPPVEYFLSENPGVFYLNNYISPRNTYELLSISGVLMVVGLLVIKFSRK